MVQRRPRDPRHILRAWKGSPWRLPIRLHTSGTLAAALRQLRCLSRCCCMQVHVLRMDPLRIQHVPPQTGWFTVFQVNSHLLHGRSQHWAMAPSGHSSTMVFDTSSLAYCFVAGRLCYGCLLSSSINEKQAPSRSNCHEMPCANNAQPAPGTAIAVLVLGGAFYCLLI